MESCKPEAVKVDHSKHAEFVCQVSNFSDYTEVIVVENDKTRFNKPTQQLSFYCEADVPDPSSATCTVIISTSHLSGKLEYKLCVGYNSSVLLKTLPQCSDEVTVTISAGKALVLTHTSHTERIAAHVIPSFPY